MLFYTDNYEFLGGHWDTLQMECIRKNPGSLCAQRACLVEGHFVVSIFGAFIQGTAGPEPQFKHSNGFDPSIECHKPIKLDETENDDYERKCCGEYPTTIAPYRHSEKFRKCCGQKTYNPSFYQCCDVGLSSLPRPVCDSTST